MTYKKGELKYETIPWERRRIFHLPHSCDEWVIGNIENAEQLVEDLQEKIKELKMKKLAKEKQLLHPKHLAAFEWLEGKLNIIFNQEKPSLLHGDLWSGNYMCNTSSRPVLIDPAVYFGHRSMDLAMTSLFGGFDKHFYDAYHYHFPFPPGYTEQWEVCNLYPLLIHLNLFGAGYLAQVENILKKFS